MLIKCLHLILLLLLAVFYVEQEIGKLVRTFVELLALLRPRPVVHVVSHADRLVLVNVLLVLFRLLLLLVVDVAVEWHRVERVVTHVVQE